MLHFFKKINKNTWRYYYFTLVYQKSRWYDLQFLRYRAWQTVIGLFGSFLPFYHHKKPKQSTFWKNEKFLETSSFYKWVPKISIMWCTVPVIYSETERRFCHFRSFFFPFTTIKSQKKSRLLKNGKNAWRYYHYTDVYRKWRSYDIWFLKQGAADRFFVILGHFLHFHPPDDPEN